MERHPASSMLMAKNLHFCSDFCSRSGEAIKENYYFLTSSKESSSGVDQEGS